MRPLHNARRNLRLVGHSRGTRDAAEEFVLAVNRDLVVIGCSAGGVDALPRLLHELPRDLPASICIAQHLAATENPYLVDILRRGSPLPVDWAEQGMRLTHAHVYVAPPDMHLLFADSFLRLSHGPRENRSRPSIDKLFRSAAAEHDGRMIGVLLTGLLDDGVAGLIAIQQAGGMTIVQDPDDAAFGELPSRALHALTPDRVLPLGRIPSAVVQLTEQSRGTGSTPPDVALEAQLDVDGTTTPAALGELGDQTSVACPDCKGPTWLVGDAHARRYRCYLGHVTGARQLLVQESLEIEAALWSAARALGDRASTLETLAADAQRLGRNNVGTLYAERAREARLQAEMVRKFITDLVKPGP